MSASPEITLTFPEGHAVDKVSKSRALFSHPSVQLRHLPRPCANPLLIAFKTGLFINNEFVPSVDGKTIVSFCLPDFSAPRLRRVGIQFGMRANSPLFLRLQEVRNPSTDKIIGVVSEAGVKVSFRYFVWSCPTAASNSCAHQLS